MQNSRECEWTGKKKGKKEEKIGRINFVDEKEKLRFEIDGLGLWRSRINARGGGGLRAYQRRNSVLQ